MLGGDGTMLRALQRCLGKGIPVVGVNFGSMGFLTTIPADELEAGLKRVFAGEYEVVELPTLEAELGGERYVAVNDVVVASSVLGRMVVARAGPSEVRSSGAVSCDGVICSTPVRIDRLQPLERRAGARLGARRDGGDVHCAARARCPPARRSA